MRRKRLTVILFQALSVCCRIFMNLRERSFACYQKSLVARCRTERHGHVTNVFIETGTVTKTSSSIFTLSNRAHGRHASDRGNTCLLLVGVAGEYIEVDEFGLADRKVLWKKGKNKKSRDIYEARECQVWMLNKTMKRTKWQGYRDTTETFQDRLNRSSRVPRGFPRAFVKLYLWRALSDTYEPLSFDIVFQHSRTPSLGITPLY